MLPQLIKFFKILNGDISPSQIAAGFAFGMLLAFTPWLSLHNLLILLLICLIRINLSALVLGVAVFSLLAWGLDPVFIALGEYLLTKPELTSMWTHLYQQDIWRLAHFNNTLTLGSLLVSLTLWLPVFLISRWLLVRYRSQARAYIQRLKLVRWLKTSKYFQAASKAVAWAENK